ncbi:MAG: NAD-dependent epimerase/dehydratase family protein [Candidatus Bathyarchaeota archaeon]|nr:MAG: NAD-dependent epimerase/dehydratase family protein [Candidatus Bathyarchaeota archaeon]
MQMNILVTGGGGYIGSGFIPRLGKEFPEATITSLDNLTTGNYRFIEYLKEDKRYRLLQGDITKRADLKKALAPDTEMVAHLAAVPGIKLCNEKPKKAIITNIYGTHLLLEEAVKHSVERFILISSAAVYGTPQEQPITEEHPLKPINLYGITKLSAEQLAKACYLTCGLSTTTLRLPNLYGLSAYAKWKNVIPRFVWQAVNNEPLTIRADGKQKRNFVHVQDVINAMIQCLKAPRQAVAGETLNIGGHALSVNQIANIVVQEGQQKLNKEVSKVYTSLKLGEVYTSEFKYDYGRASMKIGYEPERGVSQGISELFDYALKARAE